MTKWVDFRDRSVMGKALWRTFTLVDRCLNLLIHGDFRHTLSAYLGKNNPKCMLCRWLNSIEQEHCVKAAKKEGLL